MMKKKLLFIALAVLLLVGCCIAYIYWINSPLSAAHAVGMAIAKKDRAAFDRLVDIDNLIDALTGEVLYDPAVHTPDLTDLQRYVSVAAVGMAKVKIDRALHRSVDNWLSLQNGASPQSCLPSTKLQLCSNLRYLPDQPVYSDVGAPVLISGQSRSRVVLAQASSGVLGDFAKAVRKEFSAEGEQQKQNFLRRMNEFANAHPDYLISRLLLAPAEGRSGAIKSVLSDYGLVKQNFRGKFQVWENEQGQVLTCYFFSPKVNHEVPLSIQFVRQNPDEFMASWKITRLAQIKETFLELGEDTDKQVQELVAYSLQDVTSRNAIKSGVNILKHLDTDAKQIWQKFKQGL